MWPECLDHFIMPFEEIETKLLAKAALELNKQGIDDAEITSYSRAHIRYDGTDTAISVSLVLLCHAV